TAETRAADLAVFSEWAAPPGTRSALGEAHAGGRGDVHRVDTRRPAAPSSVGGPARGQACIPRRARAKPPARRDKGTTAVGKQRRRGRGRGRTPDASGPRALPAASHHQAGARPVLRSRRSVPAAPRHGSASESGALSRGTRRTVLLPEARRPGCAEGGQACPHP